MSKRMSLASAASQNNSALVQELISGGENVNGYDADGFTALHRACANGHVAVVQQLAAAGAALLANESGNSPLHWAVQHASGRIQGGNPSRVPAAVCTQQEIQRYNDP